MQGGDDKEKGSEMFFGYDIDFIIMKIQKLWLFELSLYQIEFVNIQLFLSQRFMRFCFFYGNYWLMIGIFVFWVKEGYCFWWYSYW